MRESSELISSVFKVNMCTLDPDNSNLQRDFRMRSEQQVFLELSAVCAVSYYKVSVSKRFGPPHFSELGVSALKIKTKKKKKKKN
jgi:hypothetical protein